MKGPTRNVCPDPALHPITSPRKGTVAFIEASNPEPAIVSNANLAPKTFLESRREALRVEGWIGRVVLHSEFGLLCRALGCFNNAEAFLRYSGFRSSQEKSL